MAFSINKAALAFPCSHCKQVGWCTTKDGKRTQHLHTVRTAVVQRIYDAGYEEGFKAGETDQKTRLEKIEQMLKHNAWNEVYAG